MAAVSSMVLYEDDSVEVRYLDGSRLQLSPCGSEFLLEKALPLSAHVLQPMERIRQRTQFVTSNHKELLIQALDFRNRFSVKPYLPHNLIDPHNKVQHMKGIPEVKWSRNKANRIALTDSGEVKVCSCDDNTFLYLSPSKLEFSVKYLCSCSENTYTTYDTVTGPSQPSVHKLSQEMSTKSCQKKIPPKKSKDAGHDISNKNNGENYKLKPFKDGQVFTWVIQHYSVLSFPAIWKYPLSLALSFSKCHTHNRLGGTENQVLKESEESKHVRSLVSNVEESDAQVSLPPKALPLNCPAPHLHRWVFKDFILPEDEHIEQWQRAELIKIVLCQGVVYRLIEGATSTIEIYPGDGSVIRSQGDFAKYFIHYMEKNGLNQRVEKMYAINYLPPDVPGQTYSIRSIIIYAYRILQCFHQMRYSNSLQNHFCCWKRHTETVIQHSLEDHQPVEGRCNLKLCEDQQLVVLDSPVLTRRAALGELEKLRRFIYITEHSGVLKKASFKEKPAYKSNGNINENTDSLQQPEGSDVKEVLTQISKTVKDIEALLAARSSELQKSV
ncbi:uncharacterized protein C5orf34 homolog [Polypterus senegalus]|uniref:uncharacterized protein C5orf34 homolog n=1 Tax=Polypterus senegalus TaxID=55291 RepID=UPI0019661D14|nr:uncharacterized protein C5orf34 homolog [Polypterus senegalus]